MKIISGGQTGVDRAALFTAKAWGHETGGWLPGDYRALDGTHPEFVARFGMRRLRSTSYRTRTFANVRDADVTIRLARTFDSPGERCTLSAILQFEKPYMDIMWHGGSEWVWHGLDVVDYIREYKVVNIAGNSEQTAPGIYRAACVFLSRMFLRLECAQS